MDDRPAGLSSYDPRSDEPPLDAVEDARDDARFPWPPGPRDSALEAFAETWRRSMFEPSRFFAAMPADVPLGPTLFYYLAIVVLSAGIGLFWSTVFSLFAQPDGVLGPLLGAGAGDWGGRLVDFLLAPLVSLVGLAVLSVIIHVALVVFGGARNGFGASLRALAYAAGAQLLVIVPVLGIFLALGWWLVLAVVGLREVHGTSTGRAAAAVLVPPLVLFGLLLVLGVFAVLFTFAL